MIYLAQLRKFLIAAAAAVSAIVTANALHGQAQHYAVLVSTVLGALLVYVVPNAPAKGTGTSLTYGTDNPSSANTAPAVTVVPAALVPPFEPLPPLIPPE